MTPSNLHSKGAILWIHGRSASGKTTLATRVVRELEGLTGQSCIFLDGDDYRKLVSADLGFDASSRTENIRRAALTARLLAAQGFVVLLAFETPTQELRAKARGWAGGATRFMEVALRCSLTCCRIRDPKGLYLASERNLVSKLSGVDAPFDEPETAELVIDTERKDPDTAVKEIVHFFLSEHATISDGF